MTTQLDSTDKDVHTGAVLGVRGSVVDVRFERELPAIRTLLYTGERNQIAIEVLSQLDTQHVRGIALTPTQGLARGMAVINSWRRRASRDVIGLIVFGSDQGLVGQFNDQLAEFVVRLFHSAGNLKIWAIGERIGAQLIDRHYSPEKILIVPTSVAAITPLVTTLLSECGAQHTHGELSALHVLYNKPAAAGLYEPSVQPLLPLDEKWQRQMRALAWPSKNIPQIAPNNAAPLAALTYEYLFVSIFKACAESLASENASRLAAMQRAERNIRDMLGELTQTFHRERQESIDEELFDVLAGYELLDTQSRLANGKR